MFNPVIAALFELEGELGAAGMHDAALVEYVHHVGLDIVEQALVVGYDYGGILVGSQFVDAPGNYAQGVDVEARVGLVED